MVFNSHWLIQGVSNVYVDEDYACLIEIEAGLLQGIPVHKNDGSLIEMEAGAYTLMKIICL